MLQDSVNEAVDATLRDMQPKLDAARAMLAALQAIQALPTAAVDCVRGGIDLAAVLAQAKAAGIDQEG